MGKWRKDAKKGRIRTAKRKNGKFRERLEMAIGCHRRGERTTHLIMSISDVRQQVSGISDLMEQCEQEMRKYRLKVIKTLLMIPVLIAVSLALINSGLWNGESMGLIVLFSAGLLVSLKKRLAGIISWATLRSDCAKHLERLSQRLQQVEA